MGLVRLPSRLDGTAEEVPFQFLPWLASQYPVLATRYSLLSGPLHVFQVDAFFGHFVERRKLAQALDRFDHTIGHIVDFRLGIESPNAKANRAMRQVVAGAESLQYIRWLQRRRGARRSAGNRYVVDSHQQRFALNIGEAYVQVP